MDEAVTTLRNCMLALALLSAGACAQAQALQDPTRPPAALMTGRPAVATLAPAGRSPVLQSVLIARQPGGRHVAVIDGETVRLGDSVRGARVTRIEPNRVELSRGNARQVLTLHAPVAPTLRGIERVSQE